MSQGIKSREEGTQDARFYYQLGDALQRLGKNEEAYEVTVILMRAFVFVSNVFLKKKMHTVIHKVQVYCTVLYIKFCCIIYCTCIYI